jgi:hypothetical protein
MDRLLRLTGGGPPNDLVLSGWEEAVSLKNENFFNSFEIMIIDEVKENYLG